MKKSYGPQPSSNAFIQPQETRVKVHHKQVNYLWPRLLCVGTRANENAQPTQWYQLPHKGCQDTCVRAAMNMTHKSATLHHVADQHVSSAWNQRLCYHMQGVIKMFFRTFRNMQILQNIPQHAEACLTC